jgi:hypothetical protein
MLISDALMNAIMMSGAVVPKAIRLVGVLADKWVG